MRATLTMATLGLTVIIAAAVWLVGGAVVAVAGAPAMPSLGAALPPLVVERWVGSPPLTPQALRGKVVLVDVWEFTCINWIRTRPFVTAWHARYAAHGLVVIGVHSPEFEFGKRAEHVDRGIRDHGLTYPIAIDNLFSAWAALGNEAWPTRYLFDAQGKLRGVYVGEGQYARLEEQLRALLLEAAAKALPPLTDEVVAEVRRGPTPDRPQSPETYLGSGRRRARDGVTLSGEWVRDFESIEHRGDAPARIVLDFVGGEVNLVVQPGPTGRAELGLTLDGKPAGTRVVDRSGMVALVAGAGGGRHRLELATRDDGFRAYSLTFGP